MCSVTKKITHPTTPLHLSRRKIKVPGISVCETFIQLPVFSAHKYTDEVPSAEQSEVSRKREQNRLTACAIFTAILKGEH
jgi:hypothetical protein